MSAVEYARNPLAFDESSRIAVSDAAKGRFTERLHHQFIGTEHILLGLLAEGGGIGVGVLEGLKVNRDMVREKTLQTIKQVIGKAGEQEGEQEGAEIAGEEQVDVPGEAAGLVAEGEKALTCAFCGARNPLYFHYCFNCGLRLDQEKQEGEEVC